jgi:hypothetical protein
MTIFSTEKLENEDIGGYNMSNANEMIASLGEEGKLAGLTVRVSPETKVMIADLRKRTGKGMSQIVQSALDAFFEDYELLGDE